MVTMLPLSELKFSTSVKLLTEQIYLRKQLLNSKSTELKVGLELELVVLYNRRHVLIEERV